VALGALLLGAIGPWAFLVVRRTRRLRAFGAALADTLQLMAGSLSAGLSLAQSVDTVVREGTDPIASEFRRALVESRLGVEIEESLAGIAERMESVDFEWVVMAIRIQRDVGGNLSEVLETAVGTMRERERLHRHVRALSAEGRLSALILLGMSIVLGAWMFVFRREYLRPLYTEPLGLLMLTGSVIGVVVGGIWLRKLVRVEV
jgi:tight adherence protein B